MQSADSSPAAWGRVDENGVVYVRIGSGDSATERVVGEYPDAPAEEALAFFERKFADLAGQVALLEQRVRAGAPATDASRTVSKLIEAVDSANAVGNLAALRQRLEVLSETVTEMTAQQREEARAAAELSLNERTAIVEAIEKIAASDLSNARWKSIGQEVDELFERWQRHQSSGPRLAKGTADSLWKRFSAARSTIDGQRRTFYAALDSAQKDARGAKQALVSKAEALNPQSPDAIGAYRTLLDSWKAIGRAGKRTDDQLWDRFKAAGDQLYSARTLRNSAEQAEYQGNLDRKLALLEEYSDILQLKDRSTARDRLRTLQRQWDESGRVPKEKIRDLEDRMKRIEDHVRALDEAHIRQTLPQRSGDDSLTAKLEEAVNKAERALDAARSSGNAGAIAAAEAALESRRSWLQAAKR